MPLGLVEAGGELVQIARQRPRLLGEPAQVLDQRPGAQHCGAAGRAARRPASRARASRPSRTARAFWITRLTSRPERLRLVATGVACFANPPQVGHQRVELAQEGGEALDAPGDVGPPLGRGGGRVARRLDEARQLALLARERGQRAVGDSARRPSTRFWRARMVSTRSVSRSAGLARWMTSFRSLPRPARPVPNSFSRIDRRSRYGRLHDVVDQVQVDRRARPARAAAGAGPRRRRARSAPAPDWRRCPGSHSTNFSPISDWGRTVHLASRVEGGEALVVDAQHDRRLLVPGHVHRLDHADLGAGNLHVLAGDRGGHVVEDRPHLVAGPALAVGPDAQDDHDRQRQDQHDDCQAGGASVAGPRRGQTAVHGEGRRAVRRGLHRTARAAAEALGLEARDRAGRAARRSARRSTGWPRTGVNIGCTRA